MQHPAFTYMIIKQNHIVKLSIIININQLMVNNAKDNAIDDALLKSTLIIINENANQCLKFVFSR